MKNTVATHHIIDTYDNNLEISISQFIMDRKSEGKSNNTIRTYELILSYFSKYCESQTVKTIEEVTPQFIQQYLQYLDAEGHNRGGVLVYYRSIRAFFNWYFYYNGLDESSNPFKRIRPPKREQKILDPITEDEIKALLSTCKREDQFIDARDKAIILTLADTGVRAFELCNMEWEHINDAKNQIFIPNGKGAKSRHVFYTRPTKLAIARFLRNHSRSAKWLFTNQIGEKLTFTTLRQMLIRRGKTAKIGKVKAHSFRRYFTLKAVNSGMDLLSLSRLLGHKDMTLLTIYAKQNVNDLQLQYKRFMEKDR